MRPFRRADRRHSSLDLLLHLGGEDIIDPEQGVERGQHLPAAHAVALVDVVMEREQAGLELVGVIRELVQDSGLAVIVVEQHARLALALTRRAIVLDRGRVVHASDSQTLLDDPDYLHRLVAVSAC